MSAEPLFLGLDLGTSGARAVVIDRAGASHAIGRAALAEFGANPRDPRAWRSAAEAALRRALDLVEPAAIVALAVDGTSGTLLPVDAAGEPVAQGRLYNEACEDAGVLAAIDAAAPLDSAARGATSGLARAMVLARLKPARILHQADWIAARFSGRFVSDANNALKTGYDPLGGAWPGWIARLGFDTALLPPVVESGAVVGEIAAGAARALGLSPRLKIVAGTTDGCASFLATGARQPGDGVTALGTTLTLKLLSDKPIFAPQYGVYSHRILGKWLAGGASNSGGDALAAHFSAGEIEALSRRIDPETDSGLDYYPLRKAGERFPIADPNLPPRLEPRPAEAADFLKGLFEGIAAIEALGYRRLGELGAPPLISVRSVGGGARNAVWARIRARRLGVALIEPASDEAAYGAALLARHGADR